MGDPPAGSSRLLWTPALLLCLVALGAGCSKGGATSPDEVHPEVETLYDQATSLSLDEVPDGELQRIALRHTEAGAPVWRSRVVTPEGSAHRVTLTATTGDLAKPVSDTAPPASEKTLRLLEKARLIPEEAALKVTKPDFGKVTLVEIGEYQRRPVWFVEVTTIEEAHVRRFAVDAVTGEPLDSSPLPEESGTPGQG